MLADSWVTSKFSTFYLTSSFLLWARRFFGSNSKWNLDATLQTQSMEQCKKSFCWGEDDLAEAENVLPKTFLLDIRRSHAEGWQAWRKRSWTSFTLSGEQPHTPGNQSINKTTRSVTSSSYRWPKSLCPQAFFLLSSPVTPRFLFLYLQANKNLDMSINASNNFNLNITWSLSSTGKEQVHFDTKEFLFAWFALRYSAYSTYLGVK